MEIAEQRYIDVWKRYRTYLIKTDCFSLTSSSRYYLYQRHVNMGNSINGLYNLVRSGMPGLSPVSGDVFLLYYKRLERGSFEVPQFNPSTGNYELSWKAFSLIMEGVSLKSVRIRKRFVL